MTYQWNLKREFRLTVHRHYIWYDWIQSSLILVQIKTMHTRFWFISVDNMTFFWITDKPFLRIQGKSVVIHLKNNSKLILRNPLKPTTFLWYHSKLYSYLVSNLSTIARTGNEILTKKVNFPGAYFPSREKEIGQLQPLLPRCKTSKVFFELWLL